MAHDRISSRDRAYTSKTDLPVVVVRVQLPSASRHAKGASRPSETNTVISKRNATKATGFAQFRLDRNIQRGIAAAGFQEPRPVQARTIPAALEGRDVLGLAQTGTGKTAAFALPILERLTARRAAGPRALIVAPTRELAKQIHAEIELLGTFTNVRVVTVIGGVGANAQIAALRRRPDIVVACPGRLLDLFKGGHVDLSRIETLVLDEADHMFDMGFLPDVRRILRALPAKRQNLLFSATMPREIRHLADQVLDRPQVVELAHSQPASTIEHALYPVSQKNKIALLRHIVDDPEFQSAIVFLRTKRRARQLARDLERMGHRAVAMQGNMSQGQRDRAMNGFREGRYDVLVATDIAARGIDIAGVSHVINFDVPNTPDAYTHRIGRTGRAERSGKACTFVTRDDHEMVRAIEKRLGARIEQRVLERFAGEPGHEDRDLLGGGGRGGKRQANGRGQGRGGQNRNGTGRGGSRRGQGRGVQARNGQARNGQARSGDQPVKGRTAKSRSSAGRSANTGAPQTRRPAQTGSSRPAQKQRGSGKAHPFGIGVERRGA